MDVDIGNALEAVASPGVSLSALEELDTRVAAAHERMQDGRSRDEFGYATLDLPETTDTDAIQSTVDPVRTASALITIGIGGSALGADALSAALENQKTTDVESYVLDNVDPAETRAVLDAVPLEDTVLNVVSRSGTTAETLANFRVAREAIDRAGGEWTAQTIVTTGPDGPLRTLAERHSLPTLEVPEGVPGRFGALSPVGLLAPALEGHDIDAILGGAREEASQLSPSLFESPAYAYGALSYALERRGASVNAMMPYREALEEFAEWFAQLWAESLGKAGTGQAPLRALGATDQHSQLQRYRAGPRDTMVTLLRVQSHPPLEIPAPSTDAGALPAMGEKTMGELLDAELLGTEASLAAADRPSVRLEIDALDEHSVGGLIYALEAACILGGELAEVDAFTQPAVEWGKNCTRALLADEQTPETAAVGEKRTLRVESEQL